MNQPTLHPDGKYLFQLIQKEDGRQTPAFIGTPNGVIHWLESQTHIKPEDMYVNFIIDVGAANEVLPDETVSMADLCMTVPLFSGKAFILCFKNPESYARYVKDLNQYDESITDADFPKLEDEDNG